jgi:transcriptional regulator with XRE-family HTH domain
MTPAQLRAGRALLGWSQKDLADAAGVSDRTVKRMEAGATAASAAPGGGAMEPVPGQHAAVERLRTALEAAGVRLISEPGVIGAVLEAGPRTRSGPRRGG